MPIVQTYPDDFGDNSKEEYLKRQLLEKIASAKYEDDDDDDDDSFISDIELSSDDETSTQKLVSNERGNKLALYESLVEKTRDIPLEKVLFCAEGCSLFDDLCLRVDVNQRYASLLPQWKDVAHLLEIDTLRTKWVETCVRPKEGLTKAMLEMYMQDGGTLGEVLQALLQLECLDILEAIRPKVEKFLEERDRHKDITSPSSSPSQIHENFFSVIKTLILALGQADPCLDMKQYANGLKPILNKCSATDNIVSKPVEHQVLIQTGSTNTPNYSAPTANITNLSHPYNSKLHNQSKDAKSLMDPSLTQLEKAKIGGCEKLTCRILLLFSEDGTEYASQAVDLARAVNHDEVTLDMLRLNEVSLWYEVLTNPEACCLKWSYEADYIVPVLTPKFLNEIHGEGVDSDDGLLPTSPILNRYMYTLARTQYTQSGCKNLKVRPVIPPEVLREVRTSNAVKIDPLLNSSWVPLNEERFVPRIRGMLNEYLRRINKMYEHE